DNGTYDAGGATTTGKTYTDAEVQGAIWGLTDNLVFVEPVLGSNENAQEILDLALNSAEAQDYVPGEGDLVTLLLDPDPINQDTESGVHNQAFLVAVAFDDLAEVCDCPPDSLLF
ncbi:MAG: hypothetical protein AAFZ09_01015, partial [Pseudomonadota bacterium]